MTFLNRLIEDDENIRLEKFDGSSLPAPIDNYNYQNDCTKVCFLDLETTGLDTTNDKIIEIAVKLAAIDKKSGFFMGILEQYQSFQDPGEPIKENITKINGISNDMVENHAINWETVESIINHSDIVVAHNAMFDRSFMDRSLPLSKDKIWACSVNDIDWAKRGFNSKSQEILCIWHGFYFDSHRAMSDVDALIHLVTHDSYTVDTPIAELVTNAYREVYKVCAIDSPYETKDILKARNYRWNGNERFWWKTINHEQIDNERNWLTEEVYSGMFRGDIIQLLTTDKYKLDK